MSSNIFKISIAFFVGTNTYLYAEDIQHIEKRFKKPVEFISKKKTPMKIQSAKKPTNAKNLKLFLEDVEFGKSIYSKEVLRSYFANIINTNTNLDEIYDAMDKITERYKTDRHTLSSAYPPVQYINPKMVFKVNLLEPYIDKVIIQGEYKDKSGLIKNYLNQIISGHFNQRDAERFSLLVKDLPTVDSQESSISYKRSDNNSGATTAIVNIKKKKEILGFFLIDNRGTQSSGPIQINSGANINNPLGYFSSTNITYSTMAQPTELKYLSISNTTPINRHGTKFSISGSHSKSKSGTEQLKAIKQESLNKSFSIAFSHPIIRSRETNLYTTLKLDTKNAKSYMMDSEISDDQTRVLRFGLDYDFTTESSFNKIILEYSQGLNGLGATSNDSATKTRADGIVDFNKINLTMIRQQKISDKIVNISKINTQYSFDPLLSGEEFAVGGKEYGRAYDSSEITAEHGVAFSTEFSYKTDYKNSYIKAITPYIFYDIAKTFNRNSNASTPKSQSLASTGIGINYTLTNDITGTFSITKPLTREVNNENNKNSRFFFSLSYYFKGVN
jgi:hemolysin activation/secretion protein